jgi:hypothetical protein
VTHVNRIKGLLFAQGGVGYEPLRKGRREWLEDPLRSCRASGIACPLLTYN